MWHVLLRLLAVVVFIAVVIRYLSLQRWGDLAAEIIVAWFGLLSILASSEVADFSGDYGWTRDQWWLSSEDIIEVIGWALLIVAAARMYMTS